MASVRRTLSALLLAYVILAANGETFKILSKKNDDNITKGSRQEKTARITEFDNNLRKLKGWSDSWSDSSSSKYKYKGKKSKSKKSKKSKKKKSKKHWHSSWGRPPWWSSSSSSDESPSSSSWHGPPSCQPWDKNCNPPYGPSQTPPSVFPPSYFPPPRPTFPTGPFPTFPNNPFPAPAPVPAPAPQFVPSPNAPIPTPPNSPSQPTTCDDPKDCPRPPRPFDLVN